MTRVDTGICAAGKTLESTFTFNNTLAAGTYLVNVELAHSGPGSIMHSLKEAASFTVNAPIDTLGVFDPDISITHETM